MNTNTKTLGLSLVLLVIGAFTYFVYLNDLKRDAELKLSDKEESYGIMQSAFIQQIELTEARISSETTLYSPTEKDSTIASLAFEGKRFCLYIDRSQCEQCWERTLSFLEKTVSEEKNMPQPLVIASGFNRRELQLLLNRRPISYPVYLIERPWEIERLLKQNQPFYFILESDGRMTSIFYPENLYEQLGKSYLHHVAVECFPDSTTNNAKSGIKLVNPEVDMGEVPIRSKRKVEFAIRNVGKKKHRIISVMPTCNCMIIENTPKVILPGETEVIKVAFLSNNKGQVEREIQVCIEGEETPYVFKLKGTVI